MSFGMLAASILVRWVAHRVIQGNFGTQEGTPLGSGLRFLSILGDFGITYVDAMSGFRILMHARIRICHMNLLPNRVR